MIGNPVGGGAMDVKMYLARDASTFKSCARLELTGPTINYYENR